MKYLISGLVEALEAGQSGDGDDHDGSGDCPLIPCALTCHTLSQALYICDLFLKSSLNPP